MTESISLFSNSDLQALGLSNSASKEAEKDDGLQQADFLRLLTVQLENQDPLKPQENGEFVAQMAQLSSLDSMNSLGADFKNFSAAMTSSQALQASSIVGRDVIVPASNARLVEGREFAGSVELDSSVTDLTLQISTADGELVRTDIIGSAAAGRHSFIWDGLNTSGEAMPEGDYQVRALATVNNQQVQLSTNLTFNVDSVTLGKGGQDLTLNLAGSNSVLMDEVKEIR